MHLWTIVPAVLVFYWRIRSGHSPVSAVLDGFTAASALWLLTMWAILTTTESPLFGGIVACVAASTALYPVLRRRPWTHVVAWAVVGPVWAMVIWTLSLGIPLGLVQYKYGRVCAEETVVGAKKAAWPLASRVRSDEQFKDEGGLASFLEIIEEDHSDVTIIEYGIPRTWFTFHGFASDGQIVGCFDTYE